MNAVDRHGFRAGRRRCLVAASCAALLPTAVFGGVHGSVGEVSPARLAPALMLSDHDGRQQPLHALLADKVTAVQLMFTGCSSVCPLQGALFAAVQSALNASSMQAAQLLSISIDPLGDPPAALQQWRRTFSAGPRWPAAVPAEPDLARLLAWLVDAPMDSLDRHSTQIFFVDQMARLRWRSTELPAADEVETVLRHLHTLR